MNDVQLPIAVGRSPLTEARPVSFSRQTLTHLTTPVDANLSGNVFGGVILAAVDRAAYVCAARHAGGPCVTASFDEVDFLGPIMIGEIVTLKASVNYVGRTSMEIGVRVTAESVSDGEARHTNSCYVTMVAIDDSGRPRPVPKLTLETQSEHRRYLDASARRKARGELAKGRASREP